MDRESPTSDISDIVTMPAYLVSLEARLEEARIVLGGSDPTDCSYPSGYVQRQAVYSCLTCARTPSTPGGVCLACSNTCHEGHQLVELYTKRDFRCDCGNSKYSNRCLLCPVKDAVNAQNVYNQNFRGEYCSCHRPFPDPAEHHTRAMLQCVVCEDWYHEHHLGRTKPDDSDAKDLVCAHCVNMYPFLRTYEDAREEEGAVGEVDVGGSEESESVDELAGREERENGTGGAPLNEIANEGQEHRESVNGVAELSIQGDEGQRDESGLEAAEQAEVDSLSDSDEEVGLYGEDSIDSPCVGEGDGTCPGMAWGLKICDEYFTLHGYQEADSEVGGNNEECVLQRTTAPEWAIFMQPDWRETLCRCLSCRTIYDYLGLGFLLDPEDTCEAYVARAAEAMASTSQDAATLALSTGDRVQQLNVIEAFNAMQTQLTEFLREFAASGRTVREADVQDFFDGLRSAKRRRLE